MSKAKKTTVPSASFSVSDTQLELYEVGTKKDKLALVKKTLHKAKKLDFDALVDRLFKCRARTQEYEARYKRNVAKLKRAEELVQLQLAPIAERLAALDCSPSDLSTRYHATVTKNAPKAPGMTKQVVARAAPEIPDLWDRLAQAKKDLAVPGGTTVEFTLISK